MATIADLLQDARRILGYIQMLDGEVLLAHVVEKTREYVIAHPEHAVHTLAVDRFAEALSKRKAGIPLAYITNEKEFYGLSFFVDERVLVPRPETEILVDVVRTILKQHTSSAAKICDLGTGSGCIAVALASHHPAIHVTAVDIAPDALFIALQNAKRHGVADRVHFIQSDLLTNVHASFDIIVANLPYIGRVQDRVVASDVFRHEPNVALFAGDHGLVQYERLFQQLSERSEKPHYLAGEFGVGQRKALTKLFFQYFPNRPAAIMKDATGIDRAFLLHL